MEFTYNKENTVEHIISIKSCGIIPSIHYNVKSGGNWLEKELVESLQHEYDLFKEECDSVVEENMNINIDIIICKINNSILHRISMSFYDDSTQKNRYFKSHWESVTQICENVGWGQYYNDPVNHVLIEVINNDTHYGQDIFIPDIEYAEID